MHEQCTRWRCKRHALLLVATVLMVIVVGCGTVPGPISSTPPTLPTTVLTTTATATATPSATPTSPPITITVPPSTLPSACTPAAGVRPVSSAVIFYGNTSKMQVSLTFDSDGGDVSNVISYLDTLRARGIHATFFLTGNFAAKHPDMVRRILAEGHEIGNHTEDHPNLVNPPRSNAFICDELVQADQVIIAAGGRTSRPYFRPPYGNYNAQVRFLAAGLGYRTVYWSIDPRDWDPTTTTQDILNRVLNTSSLKPGAIILMHVNSPNEQYALNDVITGLEKRNYSIVPLSQLLR